MPVQFFFYNSLPNILPTKQLLMEMIQAVLNTKTNKQRAVHENGRGCPKERCSNSVQRHSLDHPLGSTTARLLIGGEPSLTGQANIPHVRLGGENKFGKK